MASSAAAQPFLLSQSRLRSLRQACGIDNDGKGNGGGAAGDCAVLIIPGQDGKHNLGSQALLKFLVLGDCGRQLLDATVAAGPHTEAVEESLLVVTATDVRVLQWGDAVPLLESTSAAWGAVRRWVVTASDVERQTATAELFKVQAFMAMIAGVPGFQVPLTPEWGADRPTDPPSMEVETWPVVQTFGLADFGTGGFFTMKHTIVDATPSLSPLWGHVDTVALRRLVLGSVPTLRHHWWTFMHTLDSRSAPRRAKLSELVVADPLTSLYDFGRLRFADDPPPGRGACVRFGARTATAPVDDLDDATVAASGIGGDPALHMTVIGEEPGSGCRAARSYFFRTGPPPVVPGLRPGDMPSASAGFLFSFDEEDYAEAGMSPQRGVAESKAEAEGDTTAAPQPPPAGHIDFHRLSATYRVLVAALQAAVQQVGRCTDAGAVEHACGVAARESLVSSGVVDLLRPGVEAGYPVSADAMPALSLEKDVRVTVDVTDGMGVPVDTSSMPHLFRPRRLVFVKVQLDGLWSAEVADTALGSLVVGDTVVPTGTRDAVLNLTSSLPYYRSWTADAAGGKVAADITRGLSIRSHRDAKGSLAVGSTTTGSLNDAVLLMLRCTPQIGGDCNERYLVGSITMCESGLVFQSGTRGPLPLSLLRTCSHAWLVEPEAVAEAAGVCGPGTPQWTRRTQSWAQFQDVDAVFADEDTSTARVGPMTVPSCAYLVLQSQPSSPFFPGRAVALMLPDGSPLKTAAVTAVTQWHTDLPAADGERPDAAVRHELPEALLPAVADYSATSWSWRVDACEALEQTLLADACLPWPATAPADVSLEAVSTAGGGDDGDRVPVVAFVGPFGCGKVRLARAVAALNSGEHAWHVTAPKAQAPDVCDTIDSVQSLLQAALDALKPATKRRRIAFVASADTPTPVVAAALCAAAETLPIRLVTVVACVHARNIHTDARATQWVPGLREQCLRGFVQHVAVVGCDTASDEAVSAVRSGLHAVNPEAAVLRVGGGLSGTIAVTTDTIASITTDKPFHALTYATLRRLLLPQWRSLRSGRPVTDDRGYAVVQAQACVVADKLAKWLRRCVTHSRDKAACALQTTEEYEPPAVAAPWRAVGFVRFTDSPRTVHRVDAVPGLVQVNEARTVADDQPLPASSVVFSGPACVREQHTALTDALMLCRPTIPSPKPVLSADDLSEATLESIREARLHDPLPDSWVFDGTQFMDFSGTTSRFHPNMDMFVAQHLDAANEDATQFNEMLLELTTAAAGELDGDLDVVEPWWEDAEEAPSRAPSPSPPPSPQRVVAQPPGTTAVPGMIATRVVHAPRGVEESKVDPAAFEHKEEAL